VSAVLHFASGDGWLVRREDGLLFAAGEWGDALDGFAAAPDAAGGRDAVTTMAAMAAFDVPAFVVLTWGATVECVVFGALDVYTDDPTAPMLTAAGSGTWIERRLAVRDGRLGVRAGDAVQVRARLDAGVVPAGGFDVAIDIGPPEAGGDVVPTESAARADDRHETTLTPSDFAAARGDVDVEDASAGGARPNGSPSADVAGVDALAAAVGDDWMEESLGLRRPAAARHAPVSTVETADEPTEDAESTWIPEHNEHVDDAGGGALPPTGPPRPPDAPAGLPELDPPPPSPPPIDDAWVSQPPDDDRRTAQSLVEARRCYRGHLNAPQSTRCRVCGEPIDPSSAVETTRQPVLAKAVFADGTTEPIDGLLVLGRKPDRASARVGDEARLVTISASAAVSRSHVALHAHMWSLTATDCGSRGGVVLVSPGRDPVVLEPWIAQEISVGDTIYLGGPTSVRIEPTE